PDNGPLTRSARLAEDTPIAHHHPDRFGRRAPTLDADRLRGVAGLAGPDSPGQQHAIAVLLDLLVLRLVPGQVESLGEDGPEYLALLGLVDVGVEHELAAGRAHAGGAEDEPVVALDLAQAVAVAQDALLVAVEGRLGPVEEH